MDWIQVALGRNKNLVVLRLGEVPVWGRQASFFLISPNAVCLEEVFLGLQNESQNGVMFEFWEV